MRLSALFLPALLSCTALLARAQAPHGSAYYLRHPAGPPAYARPVLPAAPGLSAPGATPARQAALTAPLRTAAQPGRRWLADSLPPAPRRDDTGVQPLYDLYRNLPEDFRKHTLPAVYNEPLPVQLLRGLLGR